MDIVFNNGAKVANKEAMDLVRSAFNHMKGVKDDCDIRNSDYSIYGDDYKVTLDKVRGECLVKVKDYDENQEIEYEIRLTLDKRELSQLISALQSIRDELE